MPYRASVGILVLVRLVSVVAFPISDHFLQSFRLSGLGGIIIGFVIFVDASFILLVRSLVFALETLL